ncbi:MAG: acetyltransferase family protein [Gemmatimonadetes bacterium]|nr:acetyltransferase family protein [Gemmatimonadota bacterium]
MTDADAATVVYLLTERLRLRRFTRADLPALIGYRNDPRVARYQSWESFSADEAEAFLAAQSTLQPGTPGTWFQFAAECVDTGALVGDCALHVRGDDARQGEIGFTLAAAEQGRGYGAEMVRRVLGYAFDDLGLHRVVAVTDAENAAAAALLARVGMRREGHLRQNVWFKGRWGDEFLFAVLREEWMGMDAGGRGGPPDTSERREA